MSFAIRAEVAIEAPIGVVWQVLTDVARWGEWSTWLRYDGGMVALGSKLMLRLTPPDGGGYAFSPEVIALDPPDESPDEAREASSEVPQDSPREGLRAVLGASDSRAGSSRVGSSDARFAWIGRTGIPGVFDGEHHFVLRRRGAGTLLVHYERYSGLLSPLMARLPAMRAAPIGFEAMNAEVKARAEALRAGALGALGAP